MKISNTKFGNVEWPKLISGESLLIKDANNPKASIPFIIRRAYLGHETTAESERQYYWVLSAPNGSVFRYFILAETEYLRKSDIQAMLAGLSSAGRENLCLVKKRRSFRLDLPPIESDDEETDN